ncbi:hypothetical protein OKW43_008426 [Paraburkholderia sp. WC7.3g]
MMTTAQRRWTIFSRKPPFTSGSETQKRPSSMFRVHLDALHEFQGRASRPLPRLELRDKVDATGHRCQRPRLGCEQAINVTANREIAQAGRVKWPVVSRLIPQCAKLIQKPGAIAPACSSNLHKSPVRTSCADARVSNAARSAGSRPQSRSRCPRATGALSTSGFPGNWRYTHGRAATTRRSWASTRRVRKARWRNRKPREWRSPRRQEQAGKFVSW